jgi:putative transposase
MAGHLAGRPHDALRDPVFPRRALSPNEKYAALVAAAGYLPVPLTGEDYLELLPVTWRVVNDYGIRIEYRTYDHADLAPWRRQHSGITARKGLWEVHYDPYDLSRVFVRTPDGWVTAPWTHLPMVSAPFADFTWRHARELAAARGLDAQDQAQVARVLDDLLTRAQAGPSARVAARTAIAAADRPALPPAEAGQDGDGGEQPAPDGRHAVVPMPIFDAHAEAEKWR